MIIRKKNIKFRLMALACLFIISLAGWLLLKHLEGGKPKIVLDFPTAYINDSQVLTVKVSDEGTGIRKVWVGLVKDAKEVVLLDSNLPAPGILGSGKVAQKAFTINIAPRKIGITDGKAILRIVAKDYAWRGWGHGNRSYVEKEVLIDTLPPEVSVLSRVHNLNQGGAGLIIFKVSEPCLVKGVSVGENFFPGHTGFFQDPNIIMAFFALDHTQGAQTEIFVKATDYAGNIARAGFPHYIKMKAFKADSINISDSFLSWKMPEFDIDMPPGSKTSAIDKFVAVNRGLRQANFKQLVKVTKNSADILYWHGAFLRLPKSARKAGFADHRKYRYKGRVIDRQVHLGIDLASVSRSPVPAANRGNVVFAGLIGIYGKTVVIDHGLGLFSMYSHLSSLNVREGDVVRKGAIIGNTGTTGLAAGDHLHFSMLVHNTFVNPVEWWDAVWIKNNITAKIDAVQSFHKVALRERGAVENEKIQN